MVNTPLVPMFGGRNGDGSMEQGNFGGITSPGLDGASSKLGTWANSSTNDAGIILDDVRKFRRSARISGTGTGGSGGFGGGALGGMYDENHNQSANNNSQQQQQRQHASPSVQQNQHSLQSIQQNAINLGLAGLTGQQQVQLAGQNRSGATSPGLLTAQHAAVAQQNWRNGLVSPNSLASNGQMESDQFSHQLQAYGLNSQNAGNLSANAQLANLIALQQQMMQQQQYQQLNMAAAAGIALTPVQMLSLQQQQQQQARMGMGIGLPMNMMGNYGMGIGMGGMSESFTLNFSIFISNGILTLIISLRFDEFTRTITSSF